MKVIVSLVVLVVVATAHMPIPLFAPEHLANLRSPAARSVRNGASQSLPQNYSCAPHIGLPNHGPMPISNLTGWWYFTCNAEAEAFGEVDILFIVWEQWVDLPAYQVELNYASTTISMPHQPAGSRYHSFTQFQFTPTLPWMQLPINISAGSVNLQGSPNYWKASSSGISEQGKHFSMELAIQQSDNTIHSGHNAETGCVTYIPGYAAAADIFYGTSYGYVLSNSHKTSRIKLPGDNHWRKLTGTCHYDRQHKSTNSGGQWRWGQATMDQKLPNGWEAFEGAHVVFWGLYLDDAATYLFNSHVSVKSRDSPLVEYTDVGIQVVNSTYHVKYNVSISHDVIITINSLSKSIRVTATVPEALVDVDGADYGMPSHGVTLESPANYRILVHSQWRTYGTGYLEVTSPRYD